MRNIIDYSIRNIRTREGLEAVISAVPTKNRDKILRFLKSYDPVLVGCFVLRDPITKKVHSTANLCYEKDGYEWTNEVTYLFEKYNIKLNDDFIKKFD